MNKLYIKLADTAFEINSIYDYTASLCSEYLTDEKCSYVIDISYEDIQYEKEKSDDGYDYSEAYLESLSIYRKISECLAELNGFLMHGSLISKDGNGVIFTAPSGTGKTTHTMLWKKNIEGTSVINGDKPLLRYIGKKLYGYGTPWSGKEGLNENSKVEIEGIVLLERGENNTIERISSNEAFVLLLSQCHRPSEKEKNIKVLNLLKMTAEEIPFYRLKCNMEDEASYVAFKGIFGGKESET